MADDPLQLIQLRNDFYRDNYRRVMLALLSSIGLTLLLLVILFYLILNPPAPKYFATYPDGRIMPLVPLSEPNMPISALLTWANEAATACFTYDFVNYRQALNNASQYFTPDGWRDFASALGSSTNLNAVIKEKLVVSAVATGAPVPLQQGLLNGLYAWRVSMPMVITYQSASQVATQNVTVTMLITRISTLTNPKGIGIAQFIVQNT